MSEASRRKFLGLLGGGWVAAACNRKSAPEGAARSSQAASDASAPLDAAPAGSAGFPEKAADLILHTDRPPNLETRLVHLASDLTPNEQFFVRWHLEQLPTTLDPHAFRLSVKGEVERPLSLSLDDLQKFEPFEIVAVNQCSGNSRALFAPRMPGIQWSNGAVGNARWRGVRLKDLLDRAGVRKNAVEVVFGGLDRGPKASVPDFEKALAIDHARDGEVMVAYRMNDAALPMLNGFPLRLVVPGWYSTYWVKALDTITVVSKPFDGYWMTKAYRIPKTPDASETKDALAKETAPIARMNVRSLTVTPLGESPLRVGEALEVVGVAFDGGTGVEKVEVSTDGGRSYAAADLGSDLGKYSWRRWRHLWRPTAAGAFTFRVRASSKGGEVQPEEATRWNRGGYMRNGVEPVKVTVT